MVGTVCWRSNRSLGSLEIAHRTCTRIRLGRLANGIGGHESLPPKYILSSFRLCARHLSIPNCNILNPIGWKTTNSGGHLEIGNPTTASGNLCEWRGLGSLGAERPRRPDKESWKFLGPNITPTYGLNWRVAGDIPTDIFQA